MVTTEMCASTVSEVLRARYGDVRCATKRAARRFGCTTKAFGNWLYGVNCPRMSDLVVLMAEHPELEAAVTQLVERERQRRCAR